MIGNWNRNDSQDKSITQSYSQGKTQTKIKQGRKNMAKDKLIWFQVTAFCELVFPTT